MAEHQYPAKRYVERQGQQRHHHHGLGLVDTGAVTVQHAVGCKGWQTKTGDQHKILRHCARVGFQRHPRKNQLCRLQSDSGEDSQQQAFPQGLAHHMRYLRKLLRAHVVGHRGVDRHQQPDEGNDDDVPQGHAK